MTELSTNEIIQHIKEIDSNINSAKEDTHIRVEFLKHRKFYAEYAQNVLCLILNYSLPGVHHIDRDDVKSRLDACKDWIHELDSSITLKINECDEAVSEMILEKQKWIDLLRY